MAFPSDLTLLPAIPATADAVGGCREISGSTPGRWQPSAIFQAPISLMGLERILSNVRIGFPSGKRIWQGSGIVFFWSPGQNAVFILCAPCSAVSFPFGLILNKISFALKRNVRVLLLSLPGGMVPVFDELYEKLGKGGDGAFSMGCHKKVPGQVHSFYLYGKKPLLLKLISHGNGG